MKAQQAEVSGEKVLKAEIGMQVPEFLPHPIIVRRAITKDFQRLRFGNPFRAVRVIGPQIPIRQRLESGIVVQALASHFHHALRVQRHRAQVMLEQRRLGSVHRTHD